MQAMETIAAFTEAGHLAGPFTREELPYLPGTLKYISLFGKPRPHGGALRIINDHSSPTGLSFNEGIPDSVLEDIHLHMDTLSHVIINIILAGRGAVMSKHDLCEAFQTLPVQLDQAPKQAMKVLNCIFLALKCTYGDK